MIVLIDWMISDSNDNRHIRGIAAEGCNDVMENPSMT